MKLLFVQAYSCIHSVFSLKSISLVTVAAICIAFAANLIFSPALTAGDDLSSKSVIEWIDDDTCRVTATGKPEDTVKGITARKESARRDALMNACYGFARELIKSHLLLPDRSSTDTESMRIGLEVLDIVKSGAMVDTRYSEDQQCTMVYMIKSRQLRKKVDSSGFDLNDTDTQAYLERYYPGLVDGLK